MQTSEIKGLVFSTQRFSLHDGPGIRTTIFLKGCSLRCFWCANPESWNSFPEIMTSEKKCFASGRCAEVCPTKAITVSGGRRRIDRRKCNRCLDCVAVCPAKAIMVTGEFVSVEDALHLAMSDSQFYANSGGGVTLSGGEPLLQADFVREFARRCREVPLHIALDTSGAVPPESLEGVLSYVDLVLFDIKHMDPLRHREGTGKDNTVILNNARTAAKAVETWLRFPLVPGFNDSYDNLIATASFARDNGFAKVSVLPYHSLWKSKIGQLGMSFRGRRRSLPAPPVDSAVDEVVTLFQSFGLRVEVGR
ncbi:MAG: glycyl-radical enzyme activating protein [Dehalococcoidia bacterium]|nr:glycyl-radical enzyme activating protein [Dehalococcoidia bacterium]